LRARFDNGNRLPGTPERSAFAEIIYAPVAGMHAAVETVHVGRIFVNDANEDSAPAATLVNLRAGMKHRFGALEIEPLLRLENAANRKYAGSVIVNEANRRFFEPAMPRTWLAALTARYRF
jgi:iron complex outermembrane receptor protein